MHSELREIERLRYKAQHDEAQALQHAEEKGLEKGRREAMLDLARNLLGMGMPPGQIEKATGLSLYEINSLRTNEA